MINWRDTAREDGERFFQELADNAPVMIWRSGPDALCDWFNKPWLDFVGRSMAEEVGEGWAEGVHPDDFKRCLEIYLSAFEVRRKFTMVYRLRRADGVYREILDNGAPFYRHGAFAGYFGSCIDVTEQQATEAQLRQAQKMEAVGQLTGGVAHDFNNLLQVISGSLDLLSKDLPDDARAQNRLRNAIEAVRRGASLSAQLLAFASRQSLRPRVVRPRRLLDDAADMLRRAVGEAVELKTSVDDDAWNVLVDPEQLVTALLNLALNGRDAMGARGTLTITVQNAQRVAGGQQHVLLSVTDTGCGMSPETVERAFDPFFTTKPEGRGTGLGLSMVHGFVKQSGGEIEISSRPGRGTTVRLFLPRSRQSEDVEPRASSEDARGGSESVLLVEDDDEVRAATVDLLQDLGYAVLEARDADGAAALIDSGAPIDLLLTDVVMPGTLRSTELARLARVRLPRIRVIFTSGYPRDALGDERLLGGDVELLSKPFTREELARRLRGVLRTLGTRASPKRALAPG